MAGSTGFEFGDNISPTYQNKPDADNLRQLSKKVQILTNTAFISPQIFFQGR